MNFSRLLPPPGIYFVLTFFIKHRLLASTLAVAFLLIFSALVSEVESNQKVATDNNQSVAASRLGLPPVPGKFRNPAMPIVELGEKLFFDRRLSFNNTLSCAMCHLPADAFASTQSARAVGMEGISLKRNAPSLLNVVFFDTLFHDGRETDLEWQVWSPLLSVDEMANPSIGYLVEKIKSLENYRQLFAVAYPGEGVTPRSIGHALATYEATLLSGNSKFDRWYYGKEPTALTPSEQRGFRIFTGKAACNQCHKVNKTTALFTDFQFHNTGIGYEASIGSDKAVSVEIAPGKSVEISSEKLKTISDPQQNDIGRFAVTLNAKDRWAYRTPSLRNVQRTFPYMHNGSIRTLRDVVEHYDRGGIENENLSKRIKPLGLSPREKSDLVAFLRTLDGAEVAATAKSNNKSDRSDQ